MPRILVVDDDIYNLETMAKIASTVGGEVFTATQGREALEAISKHHPDVILLDLNMPVLDGFSVLEKLRDQVSAPKPAVIIVTANTDTHGKIRGTELGAIDFVEKPFRVEDLQRRLRRALALVDMERRLHESQETLEQLRHTDETTGAGSFGQLYTVLEAEFRRAEMSTRSLACVLVADEDYSRVLNEEGRTVGEERLQKLTAAITASRAPSHPMFRIDAAEFVILNPDAQRRDTETFIESIEVRAKALGLSWETMAVGVALYPHPTITQAGNLYRAANTALAQARSREKDRVVYFGAGL